MCQVRDAKLWNRSNSLCENDLQSIIPIEFRARDIEEMGLFL